MSDTHGNLDLMRAVARTMTGQLRVEVLFHLGDDYTDPEELEYTGYDLRRVPGLWCSAYQDGYTPKRLVEDFEGVAVACAHAEKDLRHVERAAAVILVGHTHVANIAHLGRSLYVNPGHLKAPISRGERASFATIQISDSEVQVRIHEALDGSLRYQVSVDRERLG